MPENKVVSLEERAKDEQKPFLEQLLQEGARKLLQAAIENEVIEYIQFHKDRRDENEHRLVVRNGHLPERELVSGVGPIPVRQPRVRHRGRPDVLEAGSSYSCSPAPVSGLTMCATRYDCTVGRFRPYGERLLRAVTISPTPISAATLRSLNGCSGRCLSTSKSFLRDLPSDVEAKD